MSQAPYVSLTVVQASPYSKPSTIIAMIVCVLLITAILIITRRDRRSPELKQAQRTARETKSHAIRSVYTLPIKTRLSDEVDATLDFLTEAGDEEGKVVLREQLSTTLLAIETVGLKHVELLGRAEPEFDPRSEYLTFEEYDAIRASYADLSQLTWNASTEVLRLKSQSEALIRRNRR